ncbi:unnamed protein product [Lactuca virosa]|uniref:non-specific serine/threonine protein kinase n=1 Tax=Lactuca virosa TaxID=75947 RepID=A0AAU9NSK2_9ASTR|nr:unnamed protein product [Lactuca virosa]
MVSHNSFFPAQYRSPDTTISIHHDHQNPNTMFSSGVNLESYLIPLEEINRATENFSQQRFIGSGGFGAVYKGQLSERWQNRIAAVKRLGQNSYQGEREFRNELEMTVRLQNENIISFIGYCDEGSEMIIVNEYAINGSLDHYLGDPNKIGSITWTQRLRICIGAARGLNYLHSGLGEHDRVIHRDIKSANILLDGKFVAKICDFGLSKSGPRNQPNTEFYTKVAGTQFYLDPTYLESGILRKESDLYSFGVVLYEMLSGMPVYSKRTIEYDGPENLMNFVRRYYPDKLDKLIDPSIKDEIDARSFYIFKEIANQCISYNLKERPTMETVIQRIEKALDYQDGVGYLFDCLTQNMGFSDGKPIAAFTVYKCLLHWKCLEAERTPVLCRLIHIINSAIEDRDNNHQMPYWLSNASVLLFLIKKGLKLDGASSFPKPPPQTSSLGSLTMAKAKAAPMVGQHTEAKYPVLIFKLQLATCVEKIYGIIRDNLKREVGLLLDLCIAEPKIFNRAPTPTQSIAKESCFRHWLGMIDHLNTFLNTMEDNFVPPILVLKICIQVFTYINVKLFNSVLEDRECCSFSNGKYLEGGVAELEIWCLEAKEEYTGLAWDKLKHIRQAIMFLVKEKKKKISYSIFQNLCPNLSITQLKRICQMYWDDKSVTGYVSANMKKEMAQDSNNARSTLFQLRDDCGIPFFFDDLFTSLQGKDFSSVKPTMELASSIWTGVLALS